ncbi:MAG: DNA alkylation repair protein [Cyclobacteriaceae bacterium]|nr:DNA alkylation repair protein [Cyclobacteriaceae bacterium]
MIDSKTKEIRAFCKLNANPDIVKKYSRYFKEGYDGYGIDDKIFKEQIDKWTVQWQDEMTLEHYLTLGDELMKNGRFDEKHIAISLLKSHRQNFTKDTFYRIGNWFDHGINNWATTDVLCMLVLSSVLFDEVIGVNDLKSWISSESEWKRRAVPVALVELDKLTKDLKVIEAIALVEPLMLDESEYVQKGIGTLLRGLWKKHPAQVEEFLSKWKDNCGRLIVQYATEKMDKEYRKRFRRS